MAVYAIRIGDGWHLATRVPARGYGLEFAGIGEVWSEIRSTALLAAVGEELQSVLIDEGEVVDGTC